MVTVAADAFRSLAFVRLDEDLVTPLGHRLTNPSIHPSSERPHALVRLVNYRERAGRYAIADPDGVVRSRSYRVRLGGELAVESAVPIVDRTATPEGTFAIRGFEDARAFDHHGREFAVATVRSWNETGIAQQVLLELNADEIVGAMPLSLPSEGHHKNWMPVVGASEMTFVDRCSPLRLRIVDADRGVTEVVDHTAHDEPAARGYRGGSQVIDVAGRRLAVVHEVDLVGSVRRYLHRFVAFDERLRPCGSTERFSFVGRRIEFCAGLRLQGDELVASIGVTDDEAWLARFSAEEVLDAIRPYHRPSRAAPAVQAVPAADSGAPSSPRAGIVSVTLAHAGREAAMQDALASVSGWVDRCLVVDTSGSPTIHAAAAEAVGVQLISGEWSWTDDFGTARSAALDLAAEHSDAAWAVILDTDETLDVDAAAFPRGVAAALADLPGDVHSLTAWSHDWTYAKVRFVRLPRTGRFVGVTHEYFDTAGNAARLLPGVTFRERPKTSVELAAKAARDIVLLRRTTSRRPFDGRWWYYLGDALALAGERIEAIGAFRRCAAIDTWAEEAAWATYREAQLWVASGDFDTAIERCAVGLSRHPGIAELAWYAGYAAFHAGRHRDAAAFANLAVVHGEYLGLAAATDRTLFRHPPALYEGPFDVLRHAYRALGDHRAADQAEADHRAASSARLERSMSPPTA